MIDSEDRGARRHCPLASSPHGEDFGGVREQDAGAGFVIDGVQPAGVVLCDRLGLHRVQREGVLERLGASDQEHERFGRVYEWNHYADECNTWRVFRFGRIGEHGRTFSRMEAMPTGC